MNPETPTVNLLFGLHKTVLLTSRRIDCESREQQWHILTAEVESHGLPKTQRTPR